MLMCNWFSYVCLLHSMKGTEEEVLSPCTLIHAQLKTEKRVPQKPSPRPMCTRSADDEDSACQLLRVEQGFTENRLLLPCPAQRLSHVRFAEKVPLDACGSQCQVLWLPHGCPCKIFEVDRNKIVRAEKPFPKMMLQIPQILSLGMFWFLITYGSPVHPRTTAYHLCWSEDHFFQMKVKDLLWERNKFRGWLSLSSPPGEYWREGCCSECCHPLQCHTQIQVDLIFLSSAVPWEELCWPLSTWIPDCV